MSKDFSDIVVLFARGEISKAEMDAALEDFSRDVVKTYTSRARGRGSGSGGGTGARTKEQPLETENERELVPG